MTRMIPAVPADTTQSDAEVGVFRLIEASLGDEWVALHSMGIGSHRFKPWAEIDFVLVGPPGVFCLEVKGGRVARRDGVWQFTNRHGQTSEKTEGPFEQVGGASAALRNHLVKELPGSRGVAVGYGVVMPDITFALSAPDIVPEVLCDERTVSDFSAYVERLTDYWHKRLGAQDDVPPQLSRRIIDFLRGDFDLRPSLHKVTGSVVAELVRLTGEQYRLLDDLAENARMIVRGGAGTGKTLLALEEARRRGAAGEKVFLFCFNRGLGALLKEAANGMPNVQAWHLHAFMDDVIRRSGAHDKLPAVQTNDLLEVVFPQMCIDGLIDLGEAEAVDALILDEGQDLLLDTYLSVFETLLNGGLSDGSWRVFLDHNQDVFSGTSAAALQRFGTGAVARCTLSINCRNTAPIAITTALLSGAGAEKTLVVEGPEVKLYWYKSRAEERREVSRCISRLLSAKLAPEQIVVLSPYTLKNSSLADGLDGVPYELAVIDGPTPKPGAIRFATTGSFKGLESDVVILIDVDDLESVSGRQAVYVGASRGRAILAVFLDESQREAYQSCAMEYGTRLAGSKLESDYEESERGR